VERISLYDMELADVVEDKLYRRRRLLNNITGDGTFSEEEYAELVAREVERAHKFCASMRERREQ
jgi:predicted transcriptional regulator